MPKVIYQIRYEMNVHKSILVAYSASTNEIGIMAISFIVYACLYSVRLKSEPYLSNRQYFPILSL